MKPEMLEYSSQENVLKQNARIWRKMILHTFVHKFGFGQNIQNIFLPAVEFVFGNFVFSVFVFPCVILAMHQDTGGESGVTNIGYMHKLYFFTENIERTRKLTRISFLQKYKIAFHNLNLVERFLEKIKKKLELFFSSQNPPLVC